MQRSREKPAFSAAISRAVSVGSPIGFCPGVCSAVVQSIQHSSKVCKAGCCSGETAVPCWRMHWSTEKCAVLITKSVTVMSFSVIVPVLSAQRIPAQPSVSTLCRRLTRAWCFIIRLTASARAMVTVAGKPSGMAAMAMVMPVISISKIGSPRKTPAKKTRIHTTMQSNATTFPSPARRFCSGV